MKWERHTVRVALVLGAIGAFGCLPAAPTAPANAVWIGALLPFSGDQAASGVNLEEALLLGLEQVNQAGGIASRPLALQALDTHSDVDRGLAASDQLLNERGIRIIIGPEEGNVAKKMTAAIKKAHAVQFLPGAASPTIRDTSGQGAWFRLSPSVEDVGCVIAQNMRDKNAARAVVIYNNDDYDISLSNAVSHYFQTLGGSSGPAVAISAGQLNYGAAIQSAVSFMPDSVVLLAHPSSAALLVQAWSPGRVENATHWYWSPSLETEDFVQNVSPGLIDGSLGVSNDPAGDATAFQAAFARRWHGAAPTDAAHFYFDAIIMAALGTQAAIQRSGVTGSDLPTVEQIRLGIQSIADPPGVIVHWDEMAMALQMIAQGVDIDYQGVSGPTDFDSFGSVLNSSLGTWTISGDRIQSGPSTTCHQPQWTAP